MIETDVGRQQKRQSWKHAAHFHEMQNWRLVLFPLVLTPYLQFSTWNTMQCHSARLTTALVTDTPTHWRWFKLCVEKRYQDIIVTIKKAAAKKENEVHDTRNNPKDQMGRKNAAAALEAESTLVDTVALETEGNTTERSSKAGNLRGGFAHHEHRRPDGWTSTPRGSDDEKKCSERDKTAGERLQNQRPHPLVRIGGEEDAHEIDTRIGCTGGCDLRAGERLPKQRPLGDEHPERNPEEHLGAQIRHQVEEAGSIVFQNSRSASVFEKTTKKHR